MAVPIGTIIAGAQLATSAFSGVSSFKGGRSAAKTPIGIGPMFSRISGQQAYDEARTMAELQSKQGLIAYEEGLRNESARRREIGAFKESQANAFSSGGINLAGSPLAVLEETEQLGQQELRAMRQATEARSNLLQQDALRILRMGSTQRFAAGAEAMSSEFAFAQQQRQLKGQARTAAIGGASAGAGLGILGGMKLYDWLKTPKPGK